MDWRVLVVTAVVTMLTGVLVGLAPALSSTSVNPQATFQDHSRGAVGGAARRRLRSALVVAEVALAVALTTGAGLLLRSFVSLVSVIPGFDTEHLLTWQMNLPDRLQSADERRAFYRDFFARMEALPGVLAAGGTTRIPLGSTSVSTTHTSGWPRRPDRRAPRSAVPPCDARLLRRHGHPDRPRTRVHTGRRSDGAAGGGHQRDDGAAHVPREDPRPARADGPERDGAVDDHRRRHRRRATRRARGDAAARALHHLLQNPPVAPFIVFEVAATRAAIAETVRAEAAGHRQGPAGVRHEDHGDAAVGLGGRAAIHPAHRRAPSACWRSASPRSASTA